MAPILFCDRLQVARGLGVVHPADHEPGPGLFSRHDFESLDHGLQTLVSSPLPKSQNAMIRIPALREIGILRPAGQHTVVAYVNRAPAIFVPQDTAVSRQQDRHGIGEKQQLGSDETRHLIQ